MVKEANADNAAIADAANLKRFVENLGVSEVVLALEERRNALPLKDLLRLKTLGGHGRLQLTREARPAHDLVREQVLAAWPEAARVGTGPGEMACTRMPRGPSSFAW